MKKINKILLILGLAVSMLLPSLAFAEDDGDERGSCRLDSREFAYVSQSMEEKVSSLESDLKNVNDPELLEAMKKLVAANEAVYKDAGKYAQEHDTFGYSAQKLETLRDTAMDYCTLANKHDTVTAEHRKTAYALQEMSALAVDEFEGQCNKTRRRTKKWMKKWNEIDAGNSAEDVTRKFYLDEIVEQDAIQKQRAEEKAKAKAEAETKTKKDSNKNDHPKKKEKKVKDNPSDNNSDKDE